MFYRNFFTLNVLKTATESVPISTAILNFRVKLDGSPTDSRMYKNNSKEIWMLNDPRNVVTDLNQREVVMFEKSLTSPS